MGIFYSPSENAFYNDLLKDRYVASGTWPLDARPVEDSTHLEFGLKQAPLGYERKANVHGHPSWVKKETQLKVIQQTYIDKINAKRDSIVLDESATVTTEDGIVWQMDSKSVKILMDSISLYAAIGSTPEGFVWRDYYNVNHVVDLNTLITIAQLRAKEIQDAYTKSWVLKEKVESLDLSTPEAISELEELLNIW